MIDVLEKIGAGLCGLFVLLTLGVYGYMKLPSPKAVEWLPSVYEAPPPKTKAPTGPTSKTSVVSPKVQSIVNKLGEQGRKVSVTTLQMKNLKVPQELFEFLNAEANLMPALKKAKRQYLKGPKGNTRMRIFDIQRDSHLSKLGFKDNDVIELVNGQIIEFNDTSAATYNSMWQQAKDDLREGKAISVTVTRAGRPVHIDFRL